ncbi:hypothetical protein DPMN_073403 [Dreissena polymorpha]|uniref:Uncharacterized protein n=1 Tax=Dreissena polymorpha TaxID=45954 RepID=A0A9D4HDY7_DREPO|nr:hypothetical protein DPMN_073403 [Dreissena polymorpha]
MCGIQFTPIPETKLGLFIASCETLRPLNLGLMSEERYIERANRARKALREITYTICTPFFIRVKAQSHYDAGGAPLRDPGSTRMNRGSTGMNRGSIGDDRNEPGKTGAPPGKY